MLPEPLIPAAVDRKASMLDAFRRVMQPEPLIQTAVDREARRSDAFRLERDEWD